MKLSINEAGPVLVCDIGAVHTQVLLFDVVDDRYRFLATGSAQTMLAEPYNDITIGFKNAVAQVETITGRRLLNEQAQLILPTDADGHGVSSFAATISAGPLLKMALVGLMDDLSLESLRRLVLSSYTGQIEIISLNDRRNAAEQIDVLAHLRPDLVLIAGGIEAGVSRSLLSLLETVKLTFSLLPAELRPEILFCGNNSLQADVLAAFSELTRIHFSPNIRPAEDNEQLEAARNQLAELNIRTHQRSIKGLNELQEQAKGNLLPTATAFGKIIQFLSQTHTSEKGVLGVDMGSHATVIAGAWKGNLSLGVYPELGLNLIHCSQHELSTQDKIAEVKVKPVEGMIENEIMPWLNLRIPPNLVLEYLYNKGLYPSSLPYNPEELAIEQALARALLRRAIKKTLAVFPSSFHSPISGLLPWFEPILASGGVFSKAPSPGQALLMLLDGLQPTGVSTLILDQQHVTSALGVLSVDHPELVVQVMDSMVYQHLGTIISPVGNARPGTPVLRIRMKYESGEETSHEILQGSLEVLPLPVGQKARLHLLPLHKYDVGMGSAGRSGSLGVIGGLLGVIIDARGRPIKLPADPARRFELFRKWLWTLGN
jgi:hypothetical protein